MIYKRKSSYLTMVVFMLCLCLATFAQEAEKKPIQLPVPIANPCSLCPGTQPHNIFNIDFTGLTTATYTIPGPNNPASMTNPPSTFGTYAITNDPQACNGSWISGTQNQGNILVCDGFDNKETKLFGKAMSNLVPGRVYIFSAKFKNLYKQGQGYSDPKVQLKIASNPQGSPYQSTTLTLLKHAPWEVLSFPWTCPPGVTQATPEIWLISKYYKGNDVGVDDISLVECMPRCQCDHWEPVGIKWIQSTGASFGVSTATSPCGECIFNLGNVCLCERISLTFNYICKPVGCNPTYTWEITGPNTYHLTGSSPTSPCNISFIPTEPGLYSLTVAPKCGDTKCPPCQIKVFVRGIVLCNLHSDDPSDHTD